MKVFVVLGDDRGCGATVDDVFSSLDLARDYKAKTTNCYLDSEYGEEVQLESKPQKALRWWPHIEPKTSVIVSGP